MGLAGAGITALTARVVQPCSITLAPVPARLSEAVRRTYVRDYAVPEADEVELDDDSTDPLPEVIDVADVAREALADRDKVKKREREFRFPTHITFDNEGSEIYTIIEVDTRDRPGLLYDLTRTLAANNIYIASAVIATFGAQVVDSFYVKDMFGLKLHQKSRQEALEKKLRQAMIDGAERALT